MSYALLKSLHVGSVVMSYALFFLRGLWALRGSTFMRQRWVKFVPHLGDSVLLASAIWLALLLHASPLEHAWLLAKIAALLAYIVLGSIAIKRGKTHRIRLAAWLAAQATFFYIIAVALTKNPLPWTSL